eukprot:1161676-Pelagomonas_calceolata.AAC.3
MAAGGHSQESLFLLSYLWHESSVKLEDCQPVHEEGKQLAYQEAKGAPVAWDERGPEGAKDTPKIPHKTRPKLCLQLQTNRADAQGLWDYKQKKAAEIGTYD